MQGPVGRLIALAAALVALAAPGLVPDPAPAQPRPEARAWVLVDAGDGEVLAAREANDRTAIASTTKLMTAYVARWELDLDEIVVAPGYDGAPVESLLGLMEGERMRVRDMLAGLLLASGNDAAVALAEAAADSVPEFVAEMNRAARRLGLDDTSFANPIGLDEAGNHSTPADLAALAIELREDRFLSRVVDSTRIRLRTGADRRPVVNRNTLVAEVPWVDGVKTGRTADAGYVLVGSASRKGIELVSVVVGAPSEDDRDAATLDLLRYGFSLYRREEIVGRWDRYAAANLDYRDDRLPLLAARSVSLTLREDEEVDVRVEAPREVSGPVGRGDRLGELTVLVDREPVGRVPLVAARGASAATALDRIDSALPGPRAVVWALALGAAFLVLGGILLIHRRRSGGGRLASGAP